MEHAPEYITGVIAVLAMAAALVAKIVTVRLVGRVHKGIARAGHVHEELLAQAGAAASRRTAQESIARSLDAQRLDMEGKRSRLRTELDLLVESYEKRQRINEVKRNSLLQ